MRLSHDDRVVRAAFISGAYDRNPGAGYLAAIRTGVAEFNARAEHDFDESGTVLDDAEFARFLESLAPHSAPSVSTPVPAPVPAADTPAELAAMRPDEWRREVGTRLGASTAAQGLRSPFWRGLQS